nr:unnamed protein product [Callosobruchus analis]
MAEEFKVGDVVRGWIEVENIKPYTDCKKEHLSAQLQKAFDEAQEYIDKRKENPNYELKLPPEQVKESEKEKDKEDCEEKFKQLLSDKKKPKKTSHLEVHRKALAKDLNLLASWGIFD